MAAMTGIAASTLGANFYLITLHTGYFDVSTQLDPLLHTWMLSVIAQIYLVFPLLLLAGWWLGRLRAGRDRSKAFIWAIIALFSILSFLLSLGLTRGYLPPGSVGHPKLAFYSSPTRFWEFGVGAMLMLALPLLERLPAWLALVLDLTGAAAAGDFRFLHPSGGVQRDLGSAAGRGRLPADRRWNKDAPRLLAFAKPSSCGLDRRYLLQPLPLALAADRVRQGPLAEPGLGRSGRGRRQLSARLALLSLRRERDSVPLALRIALARGRAHRRGARRGLYRRPGRSRTSVSYRRKTPSARRQR